MGRGLGCLDTLSGELNNGGKVLQARQLSLAIPRSKELRWGLEGGRVFGCWEAYLYCSGRVGVSMPGFGNINRQWACGFCGFWVVAGG